MSLFRCMAGACLLLLTIAAPAMAGPLDDYYLAAYGVQSGSAAKTAALTADEADGQPHCGTPLKHGLQRDWALLLPTTQKVLAKEVALPILSGAEVTFTSAGGHFTIHYTTSGSDAPPLLDANGNGTPDWVETVAATMEQNLAAYVALGYRAAPTVNGAPYDVFLRDLAPQGVYGLTTSDQIVPSEGFPNAVASYIEIDNDFLDSIFVNSAGGPYTPLQSLQVTTAHEYQHAIQYGYNYYFDIWYAEATATWYEDELYDSINQLYNYLPGWFNYSTRSLDTAVSSNATTIGAGYGRWIFNRYLAEQHGLQLVRNVWERLAAVSSPDGQDIPITPILDEALAAAPNASSLGADFLGLTKRFYTRDWTSHTTEVSRIHPIVSVPYSTYPAVSPAITLPHYSFAYYKFTPITTTDNLNIALSKSSGMTAIVFKSVNGVISEVAGNQDGNDFTVTGFGSLNLSSDVVMLLLVNATATDGLGATFTASLVSSVVTGVCGPADGTTVNTAPVDGLCSAGTPSTLDGTGPWSWSCLGSNGGTTDTCSANIQSYPLSLALAGTGSGTVVSDPAALSCPTGSCQASFSYGTQVRLLQAPDAVSLFTGWIGDCTGTADCTLTMDGPLSVVATFTRAPNARIGGNGYDSLGGAYDAAATGTTILALDTEMTENLLFNRGKTITLKGGYNAPYSSLSGLPTVLRGTLRIATDRLNVSGLALKP